MLTNGELATLQAQVMQRDRYLQGVVDMQRELLRTDSIALGALNDALAPLGAASGADRIYVFVNDREDDVWVGTTSQVAEWCAEGVERQLENPDLQRIDLRGLMPHWYDALDAGQHIVRLARDFFGIEKALLDPQGIRSLLVLPLMLEQQLTGFIGFDNCREEAAWSAAEIALLQAAASQISLNLEQRRARHALEELNTTLEARVEARTAELAQQNARLEETLRTLRRAQAELVQAEKLSGLGRMVAGVAHELRNPVNYVSNSLHGVSSHMTRLRAGLTELIDPEEPDNAEVTSWLSGEFGGAAGLLSHSLEGTERIGAIVDSLVNFARLDEAERKSFRLAPLVEETLRILRPKWAAAPPVTVEGNTDLMLDGHPVKLSQALMNLLDNALYAASEARGMAGARAGLRVLTMADKVVLEVHDNGGGIPETVRSTIFDPFVTTKPIGTGSGMGLSIVWSAAEEHGGKVELASTGPEGSVFWLTLPLPRSAT